MPISRSARVVARSPDRATGTTEGFQSNRDLRCEIGVEALLRLLEACEKRHLITDGVGHVVQPEVTALDVELCLIADAVLARGALFSPIFFMRSDIDLVTPFRVRSFIICRTGP